MPTNLAAESANVRRAQSGDADAVADLYHAHAPAIFRYFALRVEDQASAEDLTAEVFTKMVSALPAYTDRGVPFAAWLFRIAHDRLIDHYRRSALRRSDPLDDRLPDGQPSIESQAIRRTEDQQLHSLIDELTDEQRMVVQLRFVEGYSLEETAQVLNKTVGAIKSMQHRALRQLARRLEP